MFMWRTQRSQLHVSLCDTPLLLFHQVCKRLLLLWAGASHYWAVSGGRCMWKWVSENPFLSLSVTEIRQQGQYKIPQRLHLAFISLKKQLRFTSTWFFSWKELLLPLVSKGNKKELRCSLECKYLNSDDYKDLLWTTLSEFPGMYQFHGLDEP